MGKKKATSGIGPVSGAGHTLWMLTREVVDPRPDPDKFALVLPDQRELPVERELPRLVLRLDPGHPGPKVARLRVQAGDLLPPLGRHRRVPRVALLPPGPNGAGPIRRRSSREIQMRHRRIPLLSPIFGSPRGCPYLLNARLKAGVTSERGT